MVVLIHTLLIVFANVFVAFSGDVTFFGNIHLIDKFTVNVHNFEKYLFKEVQLVNTTGVNNTSRLILQKNLAIGVLLCTP